MLLASDIRQLGTHSLLVWRWVPGGLFSLTSRTVTQLSLCQCSRLDTLHSTYHWHRRYHCSMEGKNKEETGSLHP